MLALAFLFLQLKMKHFTCFLILLLLSSTLCAQSIFQGKGKVGFVSDAPLELIKAETEALVGVVNQATMNFAFKVNITTFDGFNSALQKEHFNEHYLETKKFPDATFLGKILLEEVCESGCEVKAVCKGKFKIHGVTQIVTIPMLYSFKEDTLFISGEFVILLADYNIKIPRIVQAKISPEIKVNVEIEMMKQ